MTTKICIVIKSFENQKRSAGRLLNNTRSKIGLPKKQILYTVLRSPHIDKKSREQFGMRMHKQLLVMETHKLREKLNWLKLHDLLGVQLKILSYYQTRLNT
uniref:ribosomal protein S10 n=1 Tax=Pellia neesiana TaxID=70144 RepID=UPI00257BD9FF|nr:ribosomal protein S10 [Pellia neesiana]WIA66950.1 ribosomal protein S10 [Pellia neesiana]WIA66991.1 ribosomal protein S10 [Pellia neesiana]WIA67032.1 ribosomal protein S10 [Pellia neesiana]